ncbi:NAD(P)/FAD-dependent oxidoreductase [Pseudomarimonas arenosa]|uniref:NAD(P)/FAD-dependent oxidoreductase n=1 Tax=Pseudomarimonas arenosa TaxID=2774145 RepID=UPI002FC37D12
MIGGGPAGSTAAIALAQRGWRVLLCERQQHPRFHIGESLLPLNLPIFERLGVLERVAAIGVRKPAADFLGESGSHNGFRFERALQPVADHAFQVRRDQFDQLLFQRAGEVGVDTRQLCTATRVERLPNGHMQVELQVQGESQRISCGYVVDASGRDTLLGRQQQLKQPHPRHRSAAIYAHFQGVERRPGEDAGNISIYRLPQGWMWMIPLPDGVMSVGAVCSPEYLKQRRSELDQFLLDTVRAHPEAARRMRAAQASSSAEATGNYSYLCTQIAGPGWVMAGDAYAFVDPIFSSGVFLAMHGAERAADMVDQCLRQPRAEARLQRVYRRHMDAGLRTFSWFIERFTTPAMKYLFEHPRNAWQIEQAVISMLAGDVFDNKAVLRRLIAFRLLFRATALALRWQAWRLARRPLIKGTVGG